MVLDEEGNGDGLIQRGERLSLGARITNVGEGDASGLLATIKNESGEDVYIRSGRRKLEGLKVGQSISTTFDLDVREGLRTQDVQLHLAVMDPERRVWTRSDISLPVFPLDFPPAEKASGFVVPSDGRITAFAGAHEETEAVATIESAAALPVLAHAGRWIRVRLAPGEDPLDTGWVKVGRTTHTEDVDKPSYVGITRLTGLQPPALTLSGELTSNLVTREDTLEIAGEVLYTDSSDGRRQLYVFVGDDKVFLMTSSEEEASAGAVPFSTSVELEEGANAITIVAREGGDDLTRRRVVVFRQSAR